MKISIAWVFDHIDADWKKIDIAHLVSRFNEKTAEIEHYTRIDSSLHCIALAQVTDIKSDIVIVSCPEWKATYELPFRTDAIVGQWYLIKRPELDITFNYGEQLRNAWANSMHFHSDKEHLISSIYCDVEMRDGEWKKTIEPYDYILEVDNKSITHRPDLWGHRGMAREIAAILNLPLKPLHTFIKELSQKSFDTQVSQSSLTPFALTIQDAKACKRLAGIYIESIENRPSLLPMALRLLKVDSKPISMIVDVTNYVMLDLGQPMHAFDAEKIPSKMIIARRAFSQEKLALLDGQTIELSQEDLIIADDSKPIGLAGIMGGVMTAISAQTKSIFVESACFDATVIRQASVRHKLRTDASARFEKSLDPHQNIVALERFVKILEDAGVSLEIEGTLMSLGAEVQEVHISISHTFLEKKLGIELEPVFVQSILKKLEFRVTFENNFYEIEVPSWRSTKDIQNKEDIVEEIGRFFGYTAIKPQLPYKITEPSDVTSLYRMRMIKQHFAFALDMHEISSYALYDEHFLREISFEPIDYLSVQNPVSEHWRRLVTSLIPHQLKAVDQNKADYDSMRFFECARIWKSSDLSFERACIAGIFYEKKKPLDFYAVKEMVQSLFDMLHLNVRWEQVSSPSDPWYAPYQTACITYNGTAIGIMGKMNPLFFNKIAEGNAYIFELDTQFLLSYKSSTIRFKPLPKYPDVARDVSMLIPLRMTVDEVVRTISDVSAMIVAVTLVDFFEKPEWINQRSLTIRFVIRDEHATLIKSDVDMIYASVAKKLEALGATIR